MTLYLNPILGAQHFTKVHRLLRHVMDIVRKHGSISNGSAGINKRLHKENKPCYATTTKGISDFSRQLVVHAQVAHIIQRRKNDLEEQAAGDMGEKYEGEDGDRDVTDQEDVVDFLVDDDSVGGWAAPALPEAPPGDGREDEAVRAPAYHLRQAPLLTITQWPGLAGIMAALWLRVDAQVLISSGISLAAVFERG